jgi:hypothetical protein
MVLSVFEWSNGRKKRQWKETELLVCLFSGTVWCVNSEVGRTVLCGLLTELTAREYGYELWCVFGEWELMEVVQWGVDYLNEHHHNKLEPFKIARWIVLVNSDVT